MSGELIQRTDEAGVAILRLNRPDKRNAFNDDLRAQFVGALEEITADDSVRALVLTGNGKSFCSGGDIAAMENRLKSPAGTAGFAGWRRQRTVHRAQVLLYSLPIPTIAAVNGAAAGLGVDLALACDFLMASEGATFAWSYISRGLIADGGGMFLLPRRVGLSKAKELIFSGRKIAVEEALRLGVVDRICKPELLVGEAQAWAAELSAGSQTALALGKSILNQTFELSIDEVFALGSLAQGLCYTSSAHREAVVEFLNRLPKGKKADTD